MPSIQDKDLLASMIFDAIEYLEKSLKNGRRDSNLKIRYQCGLAALDLLNDEYKQLTGSYYIDRDRVLQYHSKQWEVFS